MNDLALVSLSAKGLSTARHLHKAYPWSVLYAHTTVKTLYAEPFDCLKNLLHLLWSRQQNIVVFAPIGAVIRSLAASMVSKHTDPAIVVADVFGRWAIPILSSHEGGANDLAFEVANILGAEPIVTTTSEAIKDVIIGIGCRRNASSGLIVNAIHDAIEVAGLCMSQVRLMASITHKIDEKGLLEAAHHLNLPLRFISLEAIRSSFIRFSFSETATRCLNLPGVAEPSALLAGARTELVLPRTIIHGVAVALAKENPVSSTLLIEDL